MIKNDKTRIKNRVVYVAEGEPDVTVRNILDWIANTFFPLPEANMPQELIEKCEKNGAEFTPEEVVALSSSGWLRVRVDQHVKKESYLKELSNAFQRGEVGVLNSDGGEASSVKEDSRILVEDAKKYLARKGIELIVEKIQVSEQLDPPRDIGASASQGVPKKAILAADWPFIQRYTMESLEDALGNEKKLKWLEGARVGQRGAAGKDSHRWNPAMLAFCLCSHGWVVNKTKLQKILEESFKEWLSEWEDLKEKL